MEHYRKLCSLFLVIYDIVLILSAAKNLLLASAFCIYLSSRGAGSIVCAFLFIAAMFDLLGQPGTINSTENLQ
jgi:hypothetical protein